MADTSAERKLTAALSKVAKYVYWILGVILIGGISYVFYNKLDRQIASVLFFMAGVIMLYFYYVKWFVIPERKPAWAPYTTPCPDYLTVMTGASGNAANGSYKCFDFVGVSRRPDGLKKADPRQIDQQMNNPQYFFMVDPKENRESLRQRVLAQGLTWNSLFSEA
jgi:hypothetical protein